MRTKSIFLVAAVLLVASDEGFAAETTRCDTIPITRDLLRTIREPWTFRLAGHDAAIVARREAGDGIVVFVRRAGHWRAYSGGDAQVQEKYTNGRGDLFVWTYQGVEGPPPGYSGIHVPGRPGPPFCTYINNPAELNAGSYNGEYLQFDSFNSDNKGHARLRGTATQMNNESGQFHFEYRSNDGGKTWSKPARTNRSAPVPGVYRVASPIRSLASQLRHQAR